MIDDRESIFGEPDLRIDQESFQDLTRQVKSGEDRNRSRTVLAESNAKAWISRDVNCLGRWRKANVSASRLRHSEYCKPLWAAGIER